MKVLITMIRSYWVIITLLLLTIITTLSLTPLPSLPPIIPSNDKIQHFIAYSVLTFPVVLKNPKQWLWIGLFLIGWSGCIELLQPYMNRYGEWLDMVANGSGILCGIVIALLINRFLPAR